MINVIYCTFEDCGSELFIMLLFIIARGLKKVLVNMSL